MSTVSLEEFLKPISQALGRTEPPASIEPCEATKAPLPGDYRDYSTEELAQWFTEEATKMGTIVREAKPEEVSQVVLDLVNEIGQGGHIVYSDVPEIDGFGIPGVLNNASFEAVRWNPTSREESRYWHHLCFRRHRRNRHHHAALHGKVWTGSMPSAYRPHCPVAQEHHLPLYDTTHG